MSSVLFIANEHSEKQRPGGASCLGIKILDCSWEQFEEIIREAIGSDFVWKIRPGDTGANRQAVMESIVRMLREHSGSFPEEGDMFIEPQKRKPVSQEGETS